MLCTTFAEPGLGVNVKSLDRLRVHSLNEDAVDHPSKADRGMRCVGVLAGSLDRPSL